MPQLLESPSRLPAVCKSLKRLSPLSSFEQAEDDHFTDRLVQAQTDIAFVGIGCPKQEIWMHAHSHRIPGVMLGVGTALIFMPAPSAPPPSSAWGSNGPSACTVNPSVCSTAT